MWRRGIGYIDDTMNDAASVFLALVCLTVGSRVWNYLRHRKETGYLPGIRCLVSPLSVLGASTPTSSYNPGRHWQWDWRQTVYKAAQSETISVIPILFGRPSIYTSSAEVARQVVSTQSAFYKTQETTEITLIWGPNIFAANGDEWRKHRRVINPAFSQDSYVSVWQNTARVFDEMVANEGWLTQSKVEIPIVNKLTNKLALILISTCGFGNPLSWNSGKLEGEEMSFSEALSIVSDRMLARLLLPKWAYWLPVKKIQEIETAYKSLGAYMKKLISRRRQEIASSGVSSDDILSLMIQSSQEDKYNMTDAELLGNTFLLLSAGHDTTARTLDACFVMLALHQDFQEELHSEIMEAMPGEDDITFENSSGLRKLRGCFLESSRLFPAGYLMIRDTSEDMVLRNAAPGGGDLPLKQGTTVAVDMIGLHYNPKLYPDPETFKPERWYDAHENDLTMFSFGSRSCPGRKFALTEGTCFLAKLLRNWKIEMLAHEGETQQQWKERVVRGQILFNFGVGSVPVRLVRRS
ncbi:cytochrome P450 [Phanerochaete sordida]|uniref:Cytochrome P450 n=1 Tax=Phanerochaete sordida TaxID=48140 RepID=A0A9P3GD37_9APHY|nr:cytochrome P450 [Phanerochaete sordida]